MRASWFALHSSLQRHLNLSSSERAFQVMRLRHPELAALASIASLMEHQHSSGSIPAQRFAVIRALVLAAQSDHEYRSTAHLLVIAALWPGLDAVLCRLDRGFPNRRDDLSSELFVRFGEAILALDLARVTAVTSTLLRSVERDIRRDLIAERAMDDISHPIDDPAVEALASSAVAPDRCLDLVIADHMQSLSRDDACLLRKVVLLGETQAEAGRELGLTEAAARKRYQRAMRRLRLASAEISPGLSHSALQIGL